VEAQRYPKMARIQGKRPKGRCQQTLEEETQESLTERGSERERSKSNNLRPRQTESCF